MSQKKKKKILEGHKKVGKKFIPPLMQWPGFGEINWINDIIPELIWIAVLQKKLGFRVANEAMAELHTMYVEICETKYLHSFFSSYDSLSKESQESLKKKFKESKYYDTVYHGLKDLQYYYPDHPLQFLYSDKETVDESDVSILIIKETLKGILERRSEGGTLAQAAVLFNSMATRKFNAPAGSIFWEFEEIDNYPETAKSKQLASSIRSVINAFMSAKNRNVSCLWVQSFWQKSFLLDPPTLKLIR